MTSILSDVGSFMTGVVGNSVTFGIVTLMIAGAVGRFAFKTIKRFIH